MRNIAIKVEELSKYYQIYATPNHRLKQFFFPRLYNLIGKQPRKYYREFCALNDVSFQIMQGETVGIIGRNGSGKSTLLQLICGTLTPSNGTVFTNGRIAALLELGSGFNPEFTGRDNVYMYASILGLSTKEVDEKFNDITSFADIGDFIEQPLKTYSSGMMIRLAFAVAINVEPEILIIDEALSVGDELFQRKCFAKIESIKKLGATILFVSHSASAIVQLCDKAILIDYGNMLLEGNPREVTKQYHKILFSKNPKEIAGEIQTPSESNTSEHSQTEDAFSDFVSHLTATTPLRYHHDGGKITNFEFTDNDGKEVNIISSGFSGTVTLEVLFEEAFEDVVFGFHIKSVSGLELAGLSYPAINDAGISASANEKITITWHVNIPFIAGAYFFTFGVRSLSREGFIDRIVDAMAIKVISKTKSSFFGLFDISENKQTEIIRN